jgi:hypothetical protein
MGCTESREKNENFLNLDFRSKGIDDGGMKKVKTEIVK